MTKGPKKAQKYFLSVNRTHGQVFRRKATLIRRLRKGLPPIRKGETAKRFVTREKKLGPRLACFLGREKGENAWIRGGIIAKGILKGYAKVPPLLRFDSQGLARWQAKPRKKKGKVRGKPRAK